MTMGRDDLVEEMRLLAEKAKELAAEHSRLVERFQRVQKQVEELDRKGRKNSD